MQRMGLPRFGICIVDNGKTIFDIARRQGRSGAAYREPPSEIDAVARVRNVQADRQAIKWNRKLIGTEAGSKSRGQHYQGNVSAIHR